jgi:predicted ribosome quality control (RQC) complex YloA/Tae2 family protein
MGSIEGKGFHEDTGSLKGAGFLQEAAREMIPLVTGARLEKIRQLGPHLFLFTLFVRRETRRLVMSLESRRSGFHLLFEKIHGEYLHSSPAADCFKKYLEGGRIEGVRVCGDVVELAIRAGREYVLSLRIREGAAALKEGDRALFTACRHGGGVSLSSDSENEDGPGGAFGGSLGGIPETSRETLVAPPAGRPQGPDSEESVSPTAGFPRNEEASHSLVELINERLRREMRKRIGKEASRINRLLGKLEAERAETLQKDEVRKKGELMKTRLRSLRRGMVSAVFEEAEGARTEVALDPALTPLENMNRLFKRYRKLKNRERYIDDNIQRQRAKRAALAEYEKALDAHGLPDIRRSRAETLLLLDEVRAGKEIREALSTPPWKGVARAVGNSRAAGGGKESRSGLEGREKTGRSPAKEAGKRNKPFLKFSSRTGKPIYAGRDAGENERLSTRFARGNDLWFHARGGAGSHVVLRYDKKGEFRDSDIADASLIALHFSRLRRQGEGEVVYTYCKNLRKPKNAKEGTVTYHHEKTRYVRIDERALRAVMGKEALGG